MGEKALWPMVAVVAIVCTMLTVWVRSGIDPIVLVAILGVMFTGISSLIGVLLYGKMNKVEQNTNGTATAQQELVKQLMMQLAQSTPVTNDGGTGG